MTLPEGSLARGFGSLWSVQIAATMSGVPFAVLCETRIGQDPEIDARRQQHEGRHQRQKEYDQPSFHITSGLNPRSATPKNGEQVLKRGGPLREACACVAPIDMGTTTTNDDGRKSASLRYWQQSPPRHASCPSVTRK